MVTEHGVSLQISAEAVLTQEQPLWIQDKENMRDSRKDTRQGEWIQEQPHEHKAERMDTGIATWTQAERMDTGTAKWT
jgi:hypothetical protein